MSEITDTMRAIIKKNGYKNKFIASKMKISERKLSDILNGRKVIDPIIILSFCETLDVSPNELFGYDRSA